MKTLNLFAGQQRSIPATTSWYLDALGEFRGKQALYMRQSPQKLKVLREHALIESAVSSNRIEGVSVEPSRIQSVLVASNYTLSILKNAYQEFEERVGQIAEPKGAKAELVRNAVRKRRGEFRLSDIEHACPGVGREWIRSVLAEMRKEGELKCSGRGIAARWSASTKHVEKTTTGPAKR